MTDHKPLLKEIRGRMPPQSSTPFDMGAYAEGIYALIDKALSEERLIELLIKNEVYLKGIMGDVVGGSLPMGIIAKAIRKELGL